MPKFKDNSKQVYDKLEESIRSMLVEAAVVVTRKARELCKRRSGDLAKSIHYLIEPRKAIIGTDKDYAPTIELGARPHLIRPKTAGALFWEGLAHPVKIVHHPGIQPIPFLKPALEASKLEIKAIFEKKRD